MPSSTDLTASSRERLRAALLAEKERRKRLAERREAAEESLLEFVSLMWEFVEPSRALVPGWPLEAICDHLEAVSRGEIKRLLMNVPPGFMKSLVANVFFPAWEWGPRNLPGMRYISASYSQALTLRDNVRFRQVVMSDLYRTLWGHRFGPSRDQFNLVKVANDKTGWKLATSVGGVGTGERADRFMIDDGNSVKEAESEAIIASTNQWFREVVPTRLNSASDGVIINIQQRTSEADISGTILAEEMDYVHLCYDDQTEILTAEGWVRFPDLTEGVPVMGVDPATLIAKWETPTHYIRRPYEGELIQYKSLTLDLAVTPDHRMVYKDQNDWGAWGNYNRRTDWRVRAAAELPCHFYVPQAVVWRGNERGTVQFGGLEWDADVFAEFMGWYLSEGCASSKACCARIVQNDGLKADEITSVLERSPCRFQRDRHREGVSVWHIWGKEVATALEALGKSHDKRVPQQIKDLPPAQLKRFLLAFVKGDGHAAANNPLKLHASSRSKRLIDDLQECAIKCGWSTTMHTHQSTERKFNGYDMPVGPMWRIYVRASKAPGEERKWYSRVRRVNTHRISYSGYVYCVSVPSTAIVVRRRGRVTVSGNCVPMEYDSSRHCMTVIGWQDPRGMIDGDPYGDPLPDAERLGSDGELAWPERFPADVVADLKRVMGPYATAGQFQQAPTPRGGGIFKRDWWESWPPDDWPDLDSGKAPEFPPFEFVVASLDGAFTEDEENDPSALTIWGVWRSATSKREAPRLITGDGVSLRLANDERAKLMLIWGWEKHLELHGPPEDRPDGISDAAWNGARWLAQRQKTWGLVEWVEWSCRRYRSDVLLIENKASGRPVSQELERLYADADFAVELINPVGDKVARAIRVQHLFSNGIIYAPLIYSPELDQWVHPTWCETIIDRMAAFPKVARKDLIDSATQALQWMRDQGLILRRNEQDRAFEETLKVPGRRKPLYDI